MNQAAKRSKGPETEVQYLIGDLADGALQGEAAQRALDALLASEELRAEWDELHWIGDCLRSEETGASIHQPDFMTRFCDALASEPTVLAPRRAASFKAQWLRYGVPGTAAVVVASMAVWMALPASHRTPGLAAPLAVTAAPAELAPGTPVDTKATHAVDAARLNEYLRAHQELAATALHGPGAIQAASFNIIAADDGPEHP